MFCQEINLTPNTEGSAGEYGEGQINEHSSDGLLRPESEVITDNLSSGTHGHVPHYETVCSMSILRNLRKMKARLIMGQFKQIQHIFIESRKG